MYTLVFDLHIHYVRADLEFGERGVQGPCYNSALNMYKQFYIEIYKSLMGWGNLPWTSPHIHHYYDIMHVGIMWLPFHLNVHFNSLPTFFCSTNVAYILLVNTKYSSQIPCSLAHFVIYNIYPKVKHEHWPAWT